MYQAAKQVSELPGPGGGVRPRLRPEDRALGELRGRLVHRLRPAAHHERVGRLPRRPRPDGEHKRPARDQRRELPAGYLVAVHAGRRRGPPRRATGHPERRPAAQAKDDRPCPRRRPDAGYDGRDDRQCDARNHDPAYDPRVHYAPNSAREQLSAAATAAATAVRATAGGAIPGSVTPLVKALSHLAAGRPASRRAADGRERRCEGPPDATGTATLSCGGSDAGG